MINILKRTDSSTPFQTWKPFPNEAIVLVKNAYGDSKIDIVKNLWWGYQEELGQIGEGVITQVKRLDTPLVSRKI